MEDFSKYTVLVVDDEEMLRKTIVFDFKRKASRCLRPTMELPRWRSSNPGG